MTAGLPRVSVVIPVFNEEGILSASLAGLREDLARLGWPYEVILAENGSRDRTAQVAREIAARTPEVKVISIGEPNYGRALLQGIRAARGEFVVCDEIDLCDADFHRRALELLEQGSADLVVGSKAAEGSDDARPALRVAATQVYNGLLRVALGFHGTDTHGLKAFRRTALFDVVEACVSDRDVFASELVIRAERAGLRIREIPVRVVEKRPPTVGLLRRLPRVVSGLARLFVAIRIRG
jgi:glycosyltransferase involved in cell wall biosynthesis